ncbi:MAG: rod shape-determining protein MreC [Chloroflexota bacterium]|jgi:rod shape-determining protein MreC
MDLNETRERIRWVTFVVLIVLTIALLILDSTGGLDGVFTFLENPIAAVMGWTTSRADTVTNVLARPEEMEQAQLQIEQLQLQVEALERENEELREIRGEYELLQDLFNRARETPQFRRELASVIGYDSSPLFRSIIIDKGSEDGVFVGMPVESARGLVGQVYRTTDHAAMVILITDNISSIPARLGTSRATGIVRGGGLGGALTMDWIDLEAQIVVGETVLTSGLGGKFPEDMVIGRVTAVERQEAELFQQAVIQPAVDFSSLEMVFVVTDFRTIDTSIFDTLPDDAESAP